LEGLGRKDEAVKAYEEAIRHGSAQVKKGDLYLVNLLYKDPRPVVS
jgi:hypothetical protein